MAVANRPAVVAPSIVFPDRPGPGQTVGQKAKSKPPKRRKTIGKPVQRETRKTPWQLKAFNEQRRHQRNSRGFSYEFDCVDPPSPKAGANARWNPTDRQKVEQRYRPKKQHKARRWC